MEHSRRRVEEVLVVLRRIMRTIDLHSRRIAVQHGLTVPQIVILRKMEKVQEMAVGKLAREVNLSHATVTSILDRLELKGLLVRRRADADRRQILVALTPEGREILDRAPPLLHDRFVESYVRLKDWEQAQLLSSLLRVADMMDAKDEVMAPILSGEPLVGSREQPREAQAPLV